MVRGGGRFRLKKEVTTRAVVRNSHTAEKRGAFGGSPERFYPVKKGLPESQGIHRLCLGVGDIGG